ncbi:hypothetical protein [Paracoccus binzhouensis]|uniref:hypothetical protein n=1 Tax=Paracoccus binzhouensis TaxID=2796149 RepID=UPI0018EF2126|nr:hypothetical protein [Paracoccus binzhouensis]
MTIMAASIPIPAIPAVSKAVERLIGPTLEGWWTAFRSDVEGWLTWKDLGTVLLGSLWCGFMVYLLVGDAAAAISRRFSGGAMTTGATRTLQVIATIIAFPLALWSGLALSHGEKTWAWNEPVFSVISTSQPPLDNRPTTPKLGDAEAIPPTPEGIEPEEWSKLWGYMTDKERALWR